MRRNFDFGEVYLFTNRSSCFRIIWHSRINISQFVRFFAPLLFFYKNSIFRSVWRGGLKLDINREPMEAHNVD
ncbi:hypothetical protein B932_1096 [Gluconobacter oxydans H24]|uniref:Uncharacterized protein n=1 Tax=Gluconobacter thailandicus TaxID=257438 RepID=A0AAP9JHW1_GLUTH|nr:hypothetical protein B932_1096 [Gluconobacter oxydans H24]QEH95809.1 hypothetical protein FXF46_05600 [Gluconobacter thailandicus]